MKSISSRANPRFKTLKKLLGNRRKKTGPILLEGLHLVESYIDRTPVPVEFFVSEKGMRNPEVARFLEDANAETNFTLLSDALFDEIATLEAPSGIMALADRPLPEGDAADDADAVLLDGIQDPGNLGSIFRSAAAAGVRQILLSPDCAQAWSPKTLRAGMGAHFQLSLHENADLPAFLAAYKGQAVLTALESKTDLYSLNLKATTAWVFGSEGQGVGPRLLEAVALRVKIPMPGKVESLNVAAAASVCLFEMVRQRTESALFQQKRL
ncbi:MAG: RNA methyltransferase [Candidatus Accumulibacter sp.]|jgi:TrmH family RNA methyltransferase|nr:RNA methyltransferase [Accumulibacter sp.]